MTTEAYIPREVSYHGPDLGEVVVVTLYDPDSDAPHGAITSHQPLRAGERGGPLVVVGTRDKRTWRITLPEIEVCRATAVGFEFLIFGRVMREAEPTLPTSDPTPHDRV